MKLKSLQTITNHPLTRKNKISAISRFVKRGVMVRLHKYPMVYPFIGNSKLLVEKGLSSAELQIYTGLYDFPEMSFLLHFLDNNDLFVDIGANVGVYTVLASGVKGARSYAFEPIPQTFARLKSNIVINNIESKVNLLNIGVGEQAGALVFTAGNDAINHVKANTESNDNTIEVAVKSLDSVMDTFVPNLMKIDVEGFETPVIKGAQKILANSNLKGIIIELNGMADRYGFDEKWIHANLTEHGFRPYLYEPLSRTFQLLETYGNTNTLYLRDLPFIESKVSKAPSFLVLDKVI